MDDTSFVTVHIGIGNSDDKLSQREWQGFINRLRNISLTYRSKMLGEWFSLADKEWQNGQFAWIMPAQLLPALRVALATARDAYRQDSIALAIVADTELI